MKILKISLKDYGPIKDFYLQVKDFNVIFGANETGKTAIVEALTSILLKGKTRYGKPKDINIELEMGKKKINLSSTKQAPIISKTEITSLLYIPASESDLYKSDSQIRFWDTLKLMLSQAGTQTPFANLIEKLRKGIGYTPKEDNWNKEKTRLIENDKNRLEQLKNYIREIGDIEIKKKNLKNMTETYAQLTAELDEIEKFKKYRFYQQVKKLYDDYIDKKNSLMLYQRYSEEDLKKWTELEIKKSTLEKQLNEKKEIEKEFHNLIDEYNKISRTLELIEKHAVREKINQFKEIEKEPNFFYPLLIFLTGFIFLILSFRLNLPILIPLFMFLLSIIGVTATAIKKSRIRIKQLRKEQFVIDTKLILPEVKDFEDIERKIQILEDEKIKIDAIIATKKEYLNNLNSIVTIETFEKEIEDLRKKSGCADIAQLKKRIEEKSSIENEIRGLGAELTKYLDEKDHSKWQRLIDEKKVPLPLKKEVDISNADEIENELKNLKKQIEQIQSEIKIFEEVKRKQYNITEETEVLQEIAELDTRLKNYEFELQAVKKAEEILKQMSNELDNFIENLIYGEDSLSEYFYSVTQRYNKVKIENRNFIAVDTEGNEYPIELLSSGAKDQLLICFRLAALKKLFPEGTFLILDDAFIFADWQRRCRLVELLKKFVDEGNQVIYFTSDEHSRDLLAQHGAEVVTLSNL
ncbi:MAG: AAA family ATPase [candidate division WOR-3 bacterium]